ncbi:hypothetical protein MSMEI_5311 [Mycolicibacterium smegmatis MC2 155]|uniref:Uncharacterized protein n=1 Tax=Mycolicibacterium smegmatis (strain ATCC 700084 / mc(2)155) TaxID=246196 RepID=I7FSC8_MYCS2|nr:hypothetical protein MSMEI_5311 [Mycolicibacterium smegmatis MC2 155]
MAASIADTPAWVGLSAPTPTWPTVNSAAINSLLTAPALSPPESTLRSLAIAIPQLANLLKAIYIGNRLSSTTGDD